MGLWNGGYTSRGGHRAGHRGNLLKLTIFWIKPVPQGTSAYWIGSWYIISMPLFQVLGAAHHLLELGLCKLVAYCRAGWADVCLPRQGCFSLLSSLTRSISQRKISTMSIDFPQSLLFAVFYWKQCCFWVGGTKLNTLWSKLLYSKDFEPNLYSLPGVKSDLLSNILLVSGGWKNIATLMWVKYLLPHIS